MEPSVFILVLNWNGWEDTIGCLESIRRLTYPNYRIVVIDNGSTDESTDKIKSWTSKEISEPIALLEYDQSSAISGGDPRQEAQIDQLKPGRRIVLIRNSGNLGYSGGNNVGIQYALKQNADYIWILNNDIEVTPNSINSLVKDAKQHPGIGIWGSTVIDYYNRCTIQCAGGAKYMPMLTINRYALRGADPKIALDQTKNVCIDYPSGASMLVNVDILRKIGLLNEEYFCYYEEIDLATRCRKAGYGVGWCRWSIVFHKEGGTLGSNSSNIRQKSLKSEYYGNLSALIYTRNHHLHLLPIVFILRFVLKSTLFFMKREVRLFKPLIQAYRDFLRGTFKTVCC